MGSQIGSMNNVKIFVLYLMKNINYPMDFTTINDVVMQTDYVMYLDFAEAFQQMLENELIVEDGKNENGDPLYSVTRKGTLVAEQLKCDILPVILDQSLTCALRYLDFRRRGVTVSCESQRMADQTFDVTVTLREKQKVVASPDTEQDVVALYSDDFCSCISVFCIRAGVLHDSQDFLFGADSILEPEDMTSFLAEHYKLRADIPPKVLLAFETDPEDLGMLSEVLSSLAGRRVHVYTPERGTLHTLCALVEKNAAEKAKRYRMDTETKEGTLVRLAGLLSLESYPERIEAYDISNFGSEHLTAGMIVCRDGAFCKADYRSFRIRTVEGTDDYASMREALSRRLAHLSDASGSFSEPPDLILLDGGRGHVSAVRELLRGLGLEIPVFGMVKDDYHKTRALCTAEEEISIARQQDVFSLIYRIQEEVHRYTLRCMEAAKRKTLTTSALTVIPGIGPAKAKKLLLALGGLAALKAADPGQLAAVRGISRRDAGAVYAYFHGGAGEADAANDAADAPAGQEMEPAGQVAEPAGQVAEPTGQDTGTGGTV